MIPNEKKFAMEILETKQLSNKPSTEISVLIKYYYHLGLTPDEILEKMMEFMEEVTGNSKAWKSKLKRDIKSKKDAKLNMVESITITKLEMEVIEKLKNDTLERIAFGLLVMLKIENVAKERQGEWIVLKNAGDLFKDIGVNRNSVERDLLIGKLEELGYVFSTNKAGKCSMKINYIDFEGEPAMTIASFDDYIMDYHKYKGAKIIECKKCNKRLKVKGRARTQYCSTCKKEVERERAKLSMRERRANQCTQNEN